MQSSQVFMLLQRILQAFITSDRNDHKNSPMKNFGIKQNAVSILHLTEAHNPLPTH
jgi:hypothetical protein